jgi:alkylated DNA repair dioxygenase AlkB
MMSDSAVDVNGKLVPVRRTQLRTLAFTMDGREYQAIEQNAEKPSRWGQLARDGHQVVQFKDTQSNRFVAVAVDGEVTIHGERKRGKGSAV